MQHIHSFGKFFTRSVLKCCGSGMFIPDPAFWFLSFWIQQQQKWRDNKKFGVLPFCSDKFHKLENYLNSYRKKFDPIWPRSKVSIFVFLLLSSQKYGLGIRDQRSWIRKKYTQRSWKELSRPIKWELEILTVLRC